MAKSGNVNQRKSAPQAFLSYAHHDDKFLRGGIEHLREDLEDAIEFVTGEPFKIFLDKDGIEFGQHWPTLLEDQLSTARFLIPMLSPSYFRSTNCRQEALKFMDYEAETGRTDLILPIYLADTPLISHPETHPDDTLARGLRERQYRDYRGLVFEERTSQIRSLFIKELATEISKAIIRSKIIKTESKQEPEPELGENLLADKAAVEKALLETNVLITLSRRKIVIGLNAVDTMRGFWHHLEILYNNAKIDDATDRTFIWVIDVGSQLAEQPFSFDEYFNAGLLALQFQCFYRFDSLKDYGEASRSRLFPRLNTADAIHRLKRWRWLSERSVIAVQNLREAKLKDTWPKDIGISAEHVLPSATPSSWAKQIRRLYGEEIDVADATITVFLNEPSNTKSNQVNRPVYFAHTLAPDKNAQPFERMADIAESSLSVELASPGKNYDDAFQLLYAAACYRLRLDKGIHPEECLKALAYIENIGFEVLTLPNFLRRFSRVFDISDN